MKCQYYEGRACEFRGANSLTTSFELNDSRLTFRCQGKLDPASLLTAFRECLRIAVESGATQLLFDCREVIGVPTFTQRFEMGTKAAELFHARGSSTPLAAAMLVRSDFLDPNRFGQTVARNRGLTGITTDCEEEAIRFLETGEMPEGAPDAPS